MALLFRFGDIDPMLATPPATHSLFALFEAFKAIFDPTPECLLAFFFPNPIQNNQKAFLYVSISSYMSSSYR